MMAEDLSMESFHREVVIQEQAQLRRKMTERYEEQIAQLRHRLQEQEITHKNEKIKMRWEHSNQVHGPALIWFSLKLIDFATLLVGTTFGTRKYAHCSGRKSYRERATLLGGKGV